MSWTIRTLMSWTILIFKIIKVILKNILSLICSRIIFKKHTAPGAYNKHALGAVCISNMVLEHIWFRKFFQFMTISPGGHWPRKGYGDVRPWKPPFHASPVVRKGPISSKRVSSQDPLLRKFWNFSLYSLNFHPNFNSQAPKFGNFQLTSPKIWKFSAHKPRFQRQMSVRKPHTSEIRAAHPYLKKVEGLPPPGP